MRLSRRREIYEWGGSADFIRLMFKDWLGNNNRDLIVLRTLWNHIGQLLNTSSRSGYYYVKFIFSWLAKEWWSWIRTSKGSSVRYSSSRPTVFLQCWQSWNILVASFKLYFRARRNRLWCCYIGILYIRTVEYLLTLKCHHPFRWSRRHGGYLVRKGSVWIGVKSLLDWDSWIRSVRSLTWKTWLAWWLWETSRHRCRARGKSDQV